MRLLERLSSGDFKLVSFNNKNPPPYAILLHTWTEGQEVTYNKLVAGTSKDKTSYDKIRFCGGQAAADGLQYFWVDTCCIDKPTSHELSTSINSMFHWYQRASKCYVYLPDVVVPEEVADAEAFQTTWLLAPPCVEFFSKNGKRLALQGQSLAKFSIEQRMSWAAQCTTTLKEDKVYCLLGIFGVFLSLIYGEGEAYATLWLREEIERRQEQQGTERRHDLSGGCGKSALALEFAYCALVQHARHMVFWVPAVSQESFELAYQEIGVRIGVPEITKDNADIRKLVKDALSSGSLGRWLMIVDNADDSGVLNCLPHSSSSTILFTTWSRKVAGDLMPSSQALLDDKTAVEKLLEILTYLPLAIVQAAAFINNNDISVSSTVAKTWHISFDQIQRQDRLAAEYLSFMACIDCIDIPQSLLPSGGSLVQQVKALGMLAGYAFITERQQTAHKLDLERFFDMHRLGHNEQATWAGRAVARLEELVPHSGHERKATWTSYLSHAIYVAGLSNTVEETARALLLDLVGQCQASLGLYLAAENTHQQALLLREKSLGKKHIQTLVSMHEAAVAMNKQTLALGETVLGREHPSTLMTMSNLAIVLRRQGKYEAAEAMNRQTLALKETVLGREHPNTLTSMCYLARLLANQHHYDESLVLYERACATYPTVLGNDHPTTRACCQHYSETLALQRQDQCIESRDAPDSGASTQRGKGLRLLRGLARVGIKGSRFSVP
ncbi:hypothetical protein CC86DRAFT_444052 [Ophiobolus disseminans]|uniref:Heterokaryon incompatibility domain-containing protein n=1 Tax=Ophiobolus disseminans TaxID=1469910 RepID=A0A6A7A9Y8_9PLEO|nr:hypothetical protein CC86DRAFT_444052 [Ophiobolus disseminans]